MKNTIFKVEDFFGGIVKKEGIRSVEKTKFNFF